MFAQLVTVLLTDVQLKMGGHFQHVSDPSTETVRLRASYP
jgi:hypothetical protein